MREPTDFESRILAALDDVLDAHVGREKAIKGNALAYQIRSAIESNQPSERVLRKLIEEYRPAICSCTTNPGGYFLPSIDPATRRREVGGMVHTMDSYIKGIAARRKAVISAYPEIEQGELAL